MIPSMACHAVTAHGLLSTHLTSAMPSCQRELMPSGPSVSHCRAGAVHAFLVIKCCLLQLAAPHLFWPSPTWTRLVSHDDLIMGVPPLTPAVCCLCPHSLQSVAHLNLAHTKLNNLAGLTGLSVINGDLIAWDNANLTNLQGMGAVSQLYGKLWMDSNPRLQDLTGLEVSVPVLLVV